MALITRLKLVEDLGSPTVNQAVAERILTEGLLEDHVASVRPAIRKRYDILRAALRESAGDALEIGHPQGGLSLWCGLRGELDARRLFDEALRRGVALVPGANFCPNGVGSEGGCRSFVRICFGHAPLETLGPAGREVGLAARELVAAWGTAGAGSRPPVV